VGQDDGGVIRCDSCGFEVPEATRLQRAHERALRELEERQDAINGMSGVIGKQAAKITSDAKAHAKALREHELRDDAMVVLTYWQQKLAPKARELESPARLGPVIERLQGDFTVEHLKECVDGYTAYPYVVDGKRVAHGRDDDRYADAKLIFSEPAKVEKGIAMARRGQAPMQMGDWQRFDWRKVRRANFKVILKALTEHSGKPFHDEISRSYHTECPKCDGSFTLFDCSYMSDSLVFCTGCDVDEGTLLRAIRDDDLVKQSDVDRLAA